MRDNQYTTEGRIRFSEVDHTRRITLPGIVNYFQDCSTFQSEDLGLGIMHCSERKRAWILIVVAGSRRTVSGDRREDTDQYLGDRFQGIVRGA